VLQQGRSQEAEDYFRKSLDIRERLAFSDRKNRDV
jgi:hypothetical protein